MTKDKLKRAEASRRHYKRNRKARIARSALETKAQRKLLRELIIQVKCRPCADCRVTYAPYIMEFDHIKGIKLYNISDTPRYCISIDTLIQEIAKCDVVCANCHRERTFRRKADSSMDRNIGFHPMKSGLSPESAPN